MKPSGPAISRPRNRLEIASRFSESAQRLVDRFDAKSLGIASGTDHGGPALDENIAAIGGKNARENLDQGRLARAIVAQKSKHFAFVQMEADVLDGMDAAECLDDVPEFDQRAHVRRARR